MALHRYGLGRSSGGIFEVFGEAGGRMGVSQEVFNLDFLSQFIAQGGGPDTENPGEFSHIPSSER